jgi:uncharacterized Ntn-hydrolase superfamily protein
MEVAMESIHHYVQGDTFTCVARCGETRMLGVAQATSSIAVASRCPMAKARVGALAVQACPDPRLRLLGMKLLEIGYSASKVVKELRASDPYAEYRQFGVVDKDGNSAAFTGKDNLQWAGHIANKDYVAMGNFLKGEKTVAAMAESFEASRGKALEERLMRAIEAGEAAGGQRTRTFSAVIMVYDWEIFSRVDLRVDHHPEPIRELRRILEVYKPLIDYYALRPVRGTNLSPYEWMQSHGATEEDLKRYYLDGLDEMREFVKEQAEK